MKILITTFLIVAAALAAPANLRAQVLSTTIAVNTNMVLLGYPTFKLNVT